MSTATYTKLKSGDWGVRVEGTARAGQSIMVVKKSGETKSETIAKVVWAGNGISLCAIGQAQRSSGNYDPQRFNGYGARRGGYVKACVSGGNCSSFGSGRSCGGHDCDGF